MLQLVRYGKQYVNYNENEDDEFQYKETNFIIVIPFQQSTLQLLLIP